MKSSHSETGFPSFFDDHVLLDLVYRATCTTVRNLHEGPQYPTELAISHEQSDNTGVPSPLKVSEASCRDYHRTPVAY